LRPLSIVPAGMTTARVRVIDVIVVPDSLMIPICLGAISMKARSTSAALPRTATPAPETAYQEPGKLPVSTNIYTPLLSNISDVTAAGKVKTLPLPEAGGA
jgi:hypothetical protein